MNALAILVSFGGLGLILGLVTLPTFGRGPVSVDEEDEELDLPFVWDSGRLDALVLEFFGEVT